jgi:hypothetical protein
MANIVYANPFGSYVEGQSRGLEDAIHAGNAARQFRDSDVNADFMKWYAPLRRQEATTEAGKSSLALNEGLLQNAARLTALGEGGRQNFNSTLQNIYGPNIQAEANDPVQFQRIAGESSGVTPYGVYDPLFAGVGHYGYSKREILSPQEFEQQMELRHGPGWQNGPAAGGQQAPAFDSFGAATGHIPGFGAPSPNTQPSPTMPPQQGINLNAPPQQHAPQMQQPKSIWADEYNPAPANGGGINLGHTNPRINSVTGGF